LQSFIVERPLTQDLFEPITAAFGIKLKYIEVSDLVDGTLHALLCYEREGEEKFIDARLSDAFAIAVRVNAPVYIDDERLDRYHITDEGDGRFSIPASFARMKTLREALKLAVAEEKYELARQLKEEIEARSKNFKNADDGRDVIYFDDNADDDEE
jgi:bifunctional DNase/RNase